MRHLILIGPALLLAGCVSAQTTAFYGTFEGSDRPLSFCENYAEQTYRNAYESLVDWEDSYGSRAFGEANARRAADRAYERCLSGRTN